MFYKAPIFLALFLSCALPTKPIDERLLGDWVSGQVELTMRSDRSVLLVNRYGDWRGEWTRDRADVLTAIFYSLNGETLPEPDVVTAPYRFEGDVFVWGTRAYQKANQEL